MMKILDQVEEASPAISYAGLIERIEILRSTLRWSSRLERADIDKLLRQATSLRDEVMQLSHKERFVQAATAGEPQVSAEQSRGARRKALLERSFIFEGTFGDNPRLLESLEIAEKAAPTDLPVLIDGESGTGKELVAQGIHNASLRHGNPFVAFNCAALPEGLIESELFGHEEGAFTGARRGGKPGLVEIAHTGTIFLDEIGEMPPALQSRLLRVLQEREVMKLGASRATPVDVRVIAATHRDLRALVQEGAFRADLYFRLNLLHIPLPPLRERREDIAALARHLLERMADRYALRAAAIERVLTLFAPHFASYAWPGNVRELENLLARAAIFLADESGGTHDNSSLYDVFPEFAQNDEANDAPRRVATASNGARRDDATPVMREDVERALAAHGGNRAAASRALGIGRTTLWRLMKDS